MEINFKSINNLPIITVTINGKMALMLIDSGASSSIVDSNLAKKYNFKVSGSMSDTISGIGGSSRMYGVSNIVIKYREEILKMNKLMCSDIRDVRNSLGVVGILGSDFLALNNATIDYKNKVIKI